MNSKNLHPVKDQLPEYFSSGPWQLSQQNITSLSSASYPVVSPDRPRTSSSSYRDQHRSPDWRRSSTMQEDQSSYQTPKIDRFLSADWTRDAGRSWDRSVQPYYVYVWAKIPLMHFKGCGWVFLSHYLHESYVTFYGWHPSLESINAEPQVVVSLI